MQLYLFIYFCGIWCASEHVKRLFDITGGDIAAIRGRNIEDVLREYSVAGTATSPASSFVFDISDIIPLSEDQRAKFHKFVAKLLYLSKRVHPDISVALCTRVTKAMAEDERKLDCVMKYLNGTKTLGMCLGGSEPLQVTAYIDASYV